MSALPLEYALLLARRLVGLNMHKILKYQTYNFFTSLTIGAVCFYFMDTQTRDCPKLLIIFALLMVSMMKFFTMFYCRSELYSQISMKLFKSTNIGWNVYRFIYLLWFLSVIHQIILFAFLSNHTFNIYYNSFILQLILIIICIILTIYSFIKLYDNSGFYRIIGKDYFYRDSQINNSNKNRIYIYLFMFMFLYIPGLIALSKNSLFIALCYHLGTISNYYCTELPDIRYMTYIHSEAANDIESRKY